MACEHLRLKKNEGGTSAPIFEDIIMQSEISHHNETNTVRFHLDEGSDLQRQRVGWRALGAAAGGGE